jgi:hypothetical protein
MLIYSTQINSTCTASDLTILLICLKFSRTGGTIGHPVLPIESSRQAQYPSYSFCLIYSAIRGLLISHTYIP